MGNILERLFRSRAASVVHPNRLLAKAIMADDADGVRRALDRGASVNDVIELPRDRALHLAVDYARTEIVDLLLERGARPELATYEYRCFTVPLSRYAGLAGRADLATRFETLEKSATPARKSPAPAIK